LGTCLTSLARPGKQASHPLEEEPASAPATARASRRYLLTVLLLPFLAIPAFILLGRSDFFIHHGASVWVQANDAIFSMHDRVCDVVIFGDSTAMTGINPDVVQNHTGYKTCNISVTNAVLAVTNNLTLDHFLAHNPRPRILLVQLSPDDFQLENHAWNRTIYAEGLLELLRHDSPAAIRHTLLTHPQESVAFAGYAAGFSAYYAIKDVWFHVTHLRPEEDTVQVQNGFFTPPGRPRTFCDPAAPLQDPTQGAFPRSLVQQFQNTYAQKTDIVLVNVAPIPSCDQNLTAYRGELDGVTSNPLLPLPVGLFNDERHYTASGSNVVSRLVASELNEIATRNPDVDDRVLATPHPAPTLRRVRYHPTP
jgi:hypothetical protein